MMMDRSHQEVATPLPGRTPAFGVFEVADLDDDRRRLPNKYAADDNQGERLLHHKGDDSDQPAEGQ